MGKENHTLSMLQVELSSITMALENLTNFREVGDMSIQSSNIPLMEFLNKDLTVEEIETCKLLLKGIEEYISSYKMESDIEWAGLALKKEDGLSL